MARSLPSPGASRWRLALSSMVVLFALLSGVVPSAAAQEGIGRGAAPGDERAMRTDTALPALEAVPAAGAPSVAPRLSTMR